MLTKVDINGFRGLVEIVVPLRPLTVLIGQNDTGKSSFLHALNYLLGQSPDLPIQEVRRFDSDSAVTARGWFDQQGPYTKTFSARRGGSASQPFGQMQDFLGRTRMFALPASGVATRCAGSTGRLPPDLDQVGNNLADVLDFFLRNDRKRFDLIEAAVREHVSGVETLNIPTPNSPNERNIDLVIDNGLTIPAEKASAGVRLMLFFITLAFHPTPPRLILFEEPENGVHPRRLTDIMKLLRDITAGRHGEAAQIVLTTHSPYLLDSVDPNTDQVLVFRRDNDGSRRAEPADGERLKAFLDEFMLGEVWFNQGEEGLVARRG